MSELTRNDIQSMLSETYEKAYQAWFACDELAQDLQTDAPETPEYAKLAETLENIAAIMDNSQDRLFLLMKQHKTR